ncbi:MAG: dapA 3 [Nocardioides sp.]|nr:dapA 3 [Nocardioides sp.]
MTNHQADSADIPIVAFLPTPFTASDSVDQERLCALARRVGRHGIRPAVLGGMGEFFALNLDEARDCMVAAVAGAEGSPVVAGIGFSTREAMALAAAAGEAGVSVLVVNPHYYAVPTPDGLAEHVRQVADVSGLPAIVYSSATHPLTDRHVEALVAVPGFLGIKEEAYPLAEFERRVNAWGTRIEWWAVTEPVGMPFVRAGASVVTSSMASVSPGASRAFVEAELAGEGAGGDLAGFANAWEAFVAGAPEGAPGALKAMLHAVDGWPLEVRGPLVPAGAATLGRARDILAEYQALVGDAVQAPTPDDRAPSRTR